MYKTLSLCKSNMHGNTKSQFLKQLSELSYYVLYFKQATERKDGDIIRKSPPGIDHGCLIGRELWSRCPLQICWDYDCEVNHLTVGANV